MSTNTITDPPIAQLSKAPDPTQRTGNGTKYWIIKGFAVLGPLPVLLVLLAVVFGLVSPVFFSAQNLQSIATMSVFLLLTALAQMLILISGGFDLSVGSNIALTSVCTALVMNAVFGGLDEYVGLAMLWGLLVATLVGACIGLVNGIGVAILKVNPFIVTLATMSIFAGVTMVVSSGREVSGLPRFFTHVLGSGRLGVVPVPLLIAIPVVLAIVVVLRRTAFGKSVYAIGGNETAATVAGIRVRRNLIIVYVLGGLLTAYAGWLLTARVSSGQPQLGTEYMMQSITAAIIGGASLRGGRGGVGGTILGVLFLVGLTNGMNLMRMDSNQQSIAIGIALVLSVLISRLREQARRTVAVMELTRR
ncbi:ABC transporter permease [Ruicaihuangia caeni]|uniref:ABC transporter permease n=1 Tax=Ruicaihuangia caeni TaxID=3042517 RepID=A0AAW6TAD1_9MICO|nr:ABC transporter permease [Klugiella sp. YN-L-19]MDI2099364.1 ABC transporter permease [Klugiella sp. YN-L-19]